MAPITAQPELKSASQRTRFAFCMGNRAGWKTIRVRFEKFLPEVIGGEWTFVHLEDHWPAMDRFTKRLGKFQMLYDVLSGRAAAQTAIRQGATRIILATYHHCPWLPSAPGVRYFIFGDATMRQLAKLGYSPKREISGMACFIYDRGVRRQARAGHHFFCMSPWYAEALTAEHGVRPDQITIVPPSVNTEYWHPRRGERIAGALRVVFVGADFMRKGGDVLMAVAALPEFAQVQWHLVTKSPPPEKMANLTCYTGFNADAHGLRDLVQASDVLVLPTRADCNPIVILEAAASGIPSIATRMAGIGDEIEDGVSGFLIDQPDAAQLAAALRKYVATPALLATHGRAAREKIVRQFDTRVVAAKIQAAITGGR